MSIGTGLIYICSLLIGAAYIAAAIDSYSRKRYFGLGIDIMVVVAFMTMVIRVTWMLPLP